MTKPAKDRRRVGKRVGVARYLHTSAVGQGLDGDREAVAEAVRTASVRSEAFNVVKFFGEPPKRVSLLAYEEFDAHPFPALLDSWTVDLGSARSAHRTYRRSPNPPILHRKELLLPWDDPRRASFARLTGELEARGLFREPRLIGFRRQWNARLAEAGVTVLNHRLVPISGETSVEGEQAEPVERHRTAMARAALSKPVQALARHGFLDGGKAVFDYGCGRGDDIAVLASAGIPASGWDPHFSAGACLEEAEIVNLGYVLNVIEDPDERIEALRKAYGLAQEVLAVSVLVVGKANPTGLRRYRDGFLTSRGTFQKYFAQAEARGLIERTLGQEAIPVEPGIFFVFRDKVAEQRFLEGRHRLRSDISHLLSIAPPARTPSAANQALLDENREIIDSTWKKAIALGRVPHPDELADSVRRELAERLGSVRTSIQLAQTVYNPKSLARARQARVADLTVYFALNLFSRRSRYRGLPVELQRDIKAFFGSYAKAESAGRELLLSVGDPAVIDEAAREAASRGIGYLDEARWIQVDARLIKRLPTPLRAYIGCAEQIFGDIEGQADQVRIHIQSSKLTLLQYEDYLKRPLPRLRERIKINLREQTIDLIEYGPGQPTQLVYFKSRYMAKGQAGYRDQKDFDDKLAALNVPGMGRFGLPAAELVAFLRQARLAVRGFDIVPATPPGGGRPAS